ncbi:MAG: ABC transporter substrate-binding protein [Spirochaetaceae bacterium]|nr:ABC transporter substrate-binding protein [Spirochaetaceae bacterium]
MPIRVFVVAMIGLVAAALAVATGTGEQAETEASSAEMAQMGLEAPALAEQVAAGTLPPLAERLPAEPYVVQPFGETGRYGGDLRRVYRTASDGLAYGRLAMETLLRFSPGQGTAVEPNIARDFSVSDDGTSITVYLREGMRWSDGEPFTADDIMFWYEDWAINEELNPSPPTWMTVGGEPGVWEKIDDYTVRLTFPGVNGLAARQLADPSGSSRGMGRMMPKHYLSQFHPSHQTKEKLDEMVAAAELDSWMDLFSDRNNYFLNADLPVLDAWDITVAAPAARVIAERNPYYWKVDTEGHQLPYMDASSMTRWRTRS